MFEWGGHVSPPLCPLPLKNTMCPPPHDTLKLQPIFTLLSIGVIEQFFKKFFLWRQSYFLFCVYFLVFFLHKIITSALPFVLIMVFSSVGFWDAEQKISRLFTLKKKSVGNLE